MDKSFFRPTYKIIPPAPKEVDEPIAESNYQCSINKSHSSEMSPSRRSIARANLFATVPEYIRRGGKSQKRDGQYEKAVPYLIKILKSMLPRDPLSDLRSTLDVHRPLVRVSSDPTSQSQQREHRKSENHLRAHDSSSFPVPAPPPPAPVSHSALLSHPLLSTETAPLQTDVGGAATRDR